MNRELLQQVLATLNRCRPQIRGVFPCEDADAAIELIQAELAKPLPEPVAWMYDGLWEGTNQETAVPVIRVKRINLTNLPEEVKEIPLYAHPAQRIPLSDDEISDIYINTNIYQNTARAIENKVYEKLGI